MAHPIAARNWFDHAVEAMAPNWAARRYAARAQIEMARSVPSSTYRGAIAGRFSSRWNSNDTSFRGGRGADRRDQGSMRDRARTVYRENAIGRSLLTTETDNIVAEGFTLQMQTSSPEFNKEATDRFYQWLEHADVAGKATASDLFRTSWREPRKDGDGGFLLAQRGSYPVLQYIAGDLIQNPWGKSTDKKTRFDWRNTFDGVECDPAGRPIRFWVRDVDETGKDSFTPIDARDFVYLAHLNEPNAVRGATVYACIFELLDQIDAYRDSVTKASIMACIFGLIEKRNKPASMLAGLGLATNSEGNQQKAISYENGMLKVLGTEESMFQVQASQPMQQTPEFMRALARVAAIGFDMPIEVALRDLSQVNFSGGQLGMKGYERTCRVRQDWLKSSCWNRIGYWWLSKERQRQKLGFDDAFKTPFPDDYGVFEMHAREWLLRDRLGEAKADLFEISIGLSSLQRACAQRSVDYKDNLRQREEAWKDNEQAGLPNLLSSDTRDAKQSVTAVDADGNPIGGAAQASAPLNGIQITAAMDVLAKLAEQTIPRDAAIEMLSRLGIAPDRAEKIASAAEANRSSISATDREFQREMLKQLMAVPAAREAVYNGVDIEDLIAQTGMPPEKGYQAPFIPVVAATGPLVSGAVINDPEGDIVGGDVENNLPAEDPKRNGPPPPSDPPPGKASDDPAPDAPPPSSDDAEKADFPRIAARVLEAVSTADKNAVAREAAAELRNEKQLHRLEAMMETLIKAGADQEARRQLAVDGVNLIRQHMKATNTLSTQVEKLVESKVKKEPESPAEPPRSVGRDGERQQKDEDLPGDDQGGKKKPAE